MYCFKAIEPRCWIESCVWITVVYILQLNSTWIFNRDIHQFLLRIRIQVSILDPDPQHTGYIRLKMPD